MSMQPCNTCNACSFPERVADAKNRLPEGWRKDLHDGDAPDQMWLSALNWYDDFIKIGTDVPLTFNEMLCGGELDDEDWLWVNKQVRELGSSRTFMP